jgi:transcriptional regulator with XRE-family HTH domain
MLNIEQSTYAQYERGTKQPSIPIIKDMVKIFCCTADELLFGDSEYEIALDDIVSGLKAKTCSPEEAHEAYLDAERKKKERARLYILKRAPTGGAAV